MKKALLIIETDVNGYIFTEYASEEKTLDAFAVYLVLISQTDKDALHALQKLANYVPRHIEAKYSAQYNVRNSELPKNKEREVKEVKEVKEATKPEKKPKVVKAKSKTKEKKKGKK